MRLIDADALDAAFTDLRFNTDRTMKHWGDRQDWCLHGSEVEKLIENAPTVSGWVSVQDRLPDTSGWYLVSLVNTRTGHRWEVPVSADYSHGKWDYAYLGEKDATWMLNNTVTHWMPLPEPPKEEKE